MTQEVEHMNLTSWVPEVAAVVGEPVAQQTEADNPETAKHRATFALTPDTQGAMMITLIKGLNDNNYFALEVEAEGKTDKRNRVVLSTVKDKVIVFNPEGMSLLVIEKDGRVLSYLDMVAK